MASDDHEHRQRWRVKREITLGDILLALAIVLPMIYYISKLETRVSVIEEKQVAAQEAQRRVDASQDAVMRDSLGRIETALRDIQQFLLTNRIKQ